MIVDFPEAKKIIKKTLDKLLREKVKQNSPMLYLASKKILFEGDQISVCQPDGKKRTSKFQTAESQFSIAHKDLPGTTATDVIDKLSVAAEDMAGQMERHLFQSLNETVEENGNWLKGNPSLTPDSILQALEKIWIDFEDDDREKPIKPSIVAAPGAIEDLKRADASSTPEDKKQYEEKEKVILDKKYQEYMTDLESRKIID